jgi:hypothetical protein
MRQRIILIILAVLPLACLAEPEKDLATLARENNMVTVKNYCVDYWTTDSSRRDSLSKVSSVSELCGCIQEDMKFTVSDDLATRLLQMQAGHQAGSANKYVGDDAILQTTKEWLDRYSAASVSCGERFMRRKNQR